MTGIGKLKFDKSHPWVFHQKLKINGLDSCSTNPVGALQSLISILSRQRQ